MFTDQLTTITNQQNKAFKVFTDAKKRFHQGIAKAQEFIAKNESEVDKLHDELQEKLDINSALKGRIVTMEKSVQQINQFIGE